MHIGEGSIYMNAHMREVSNLRRVLEDVKVCLDEGHGIADSPCTPKRAGKERRVVGVERDDDTKDGTAGIVPSPHTRTPTPYCLWVPR